MLINGVNVEIKLITVVVIHEGIHYSSCSFINEDEATEFAKAFFCPITEKNPFGFDDEMSYLYKLVHNNDTTLNEIDSFIRNATEEDVTDIQLVINRKML